MSEQTCPDARGLSLVLNLPETSMAHEPACSPDGSILAYMLSLPGIGSDIPGLQISLICGLDRATGKGRILLQGSTATEALEEPAWTPDGAVIARVTGSGGGVAILDTANQQRRQLTEQGDFGGISWAPATPAAP